MSNNQDLGYLRDRMGGPILEIIDPKDYSVDDILKSYYREIEVIAAKYIRPRVEKADLVKEGIIGLMDAITRFDMSRANNNPRAFHNLAIVRITDAMYSFFLKNHSPYTLPSYLARGLNHLSQVKKIVEGHSFTGSLDDVIRKRRCPEFDAQVPKDVADKLEERKDKIDRLAQSINNTYEDLVARMLSDERGIEDYERRDEMDYNTPEAQAANREFLEKFLGSLKEGPREIVEMSLQGMTLEEIGEKRGLTRQRVQQIRQEAMEFLKKSRMFKGSL